MWRTLQERYPRDKDYPARVARIAALQRVLDGTMYDVLRHAFHDEITSSGEYIKLRDRRPSVRYNLCRMVVDQSVSMLFSEGHWPEVVSQDEESSQTINKILRDACANQTMIDAATRGSVGSVCVWLRILAGRIYLDALDTTYLTPEWNPDRPDELLAVTERRKLKGADLVAMGYPIDPKDVSADFWWTRIWTIDAEEWYAPQKTSSKAQPRIDRDRTVGHALGFVPLVWIRNLPGGDSVDGAPTFPDAAIETQIEVEYQLSQAGRGLKYSSDPLLMIKEPATDTLGQFVRSASNAIQVSEKGDVKLVEIDGTASAAVIEYVRTLREIAIEQMHGNRVNPDKLSGAQSGRAMELLNQPMIWLADRLRISYGDHGLLQIVRMIVKVAQLSTLVDADGDKYPDIAAAPCSLRWPAWYSPTTTDLAQIASTLRVHTDAGHLSQASAVRIAAPLYDIRDVDGEMAAIKQDEAARAAMAPQVQEKITA